VITLIECPYPFIRSVLLFLFCSTRVAFDSYPILMFGNTVLIFVYFFNYRLVFVYFFSSDVLYLKFCLYFVRGSVNVYDFVILFFYYYYWLFWSYCQQFQACNILVTRLLQLGLAQVWRNCFVRLWRNRNLTTLTFFLNVDHTLT
jgi:hypothetical protein